MTVVERLREVQSLKRGDPFPDWAKANNWGEFISKLCGEAADEIERLSRKQVDLTGEWGRIWGGA